MALEADFLNALRKVSLYQRLGKVVQLTGLSIEANGPDAAIGEVCQIMPRHSAVAIKAEVIGLRENRVILMPYGDTRGIGVGCEVYATGDMPQIAVGDALLGRVLDAFGQPLDNGVVPICTEMRPLRCQAPNPLSRPRIERIIETGVRAVDGLLTLGQGQRVGIFAGSGVGKSTLLGMIARNISADVNVIALIGERGREVREFIEKHLGRAGLERSVVITATADLPALARVRAAYAATSIAEYFRDQGKQVLLTMDSVTRFAMAKREIGLAAGEPPTARGYTPSVFAELPELCERCGTAAGGGTISAIYTVLVEGDDFNEPISDILRATLDGHIILSRRLAQTGHYPAIDVLQSASRLLTDLISPEDIELVRRAISIMACYERNREMIDIGAYRKGSNAEIDHAISLMPMLNELLQQHNEDRRPRGSVMQQLRQCMEAR